MHLIPSQGTTRPLKKMHVKYVYISGCQLSNILAPKGHLAMAMPGDIFVVTLELVTGIQWVEGKDLLNILQCAPTPSIHTKELSTQNVRRWTFIFTCKCNSGTEKS